ncbi:hypothetical protein MPER_12034 [Moniliophthora perniciosa FA553]|nr:hypothetical protein MPER_12034 [Moniliophthora perniciosa FA553]
MSSYDNLSLPYLTLGFVLGFIFYKVTDHRTQMIKLAEIPTLGSSGFLSSYVEAFKFVFNARDIIQEGYQRVTSPCLLLEVRLIYNLVPWVGF